MEIKEIMDSMELDNLKTVLVQATEYPIEIDTLRQLVQEDKYPIIVKDLITWKKDFEEVQKEIEKWFNNYFISVEEQFDWFLFKAHHNNAIDICSDTSDYNRPLESIDFNYGSLTCTISARNDKNEPVLLPTFDGYIRRGGEELEGCCTDLNYNTICAVIRYLQMRAVKDALK